MVVEKLLKEKRAREKYFRNYYQYAKEIKEIARKYFKENLHEVFVFGSVLEDYHVMLSDIDIAIVLKEDVSWKEKILFKVEISKKFKSNPFEIHVIPLNVWKFYLNFIKSKL